MSDVHPGSQASADTARQALIALRAEVAKAVVGQDAAVTGLVIALLCRGHVLLEGVPGVAKTLLVRAVAAALDAGHQAGPVHPRPDARRRHRLAGLRRAHRRVRVPARARSSPTCCSPTRSTARRRRPRRRCWRRWRSGRSRVDGGRRAAAGPVPRGRHPEPDRVRGHLPAARGAARPVPAQADRAAARAGTRSSACCAARRRLRPARPAPRPACARSPAPPTSPPPGRRSQRSQRRRAVLGVHRRPVPGHPDAPRRWSSGASPRGATALLARGEGVGLAVRPRLRHPRRREGAGPADAAAPGAAAPRGRAGGRRPPTRCSTRVLATVPVPR